MKAVKLRAANDIHVVEVDEPRPTEGNVVVKLVRAGICASDLAIVAGKNPLARYPLTPGHECVGIVAAVDGPTPFGVGDWVSVYPSIGCGSCTACLEDRTNHCMDLQVLGITRDGGFFAEKFSVATDQLIALPPPLRTASAALIEPLAVAVHVVNIGHRAAGERVLVIGAGVIGLLTAQVARARGAREVILVDRFEQRQQAAEELGFKEFLLSHPRLDREVIDRYGVVDTVYDTVCNTATVDTAVEVLAPGSSLVLVASPKDDALLPVSFLKVYRRELRLLASRNYVKADFLDAIALLESGEVSVEPLISDQFKLEELPEALAALSAEPWNHLKVLIEP